MEMIFLMIHVKTFEIIEAMWFPLSEFGKSKWNADDLWRLWNSGQDTNFHQSMGISEKLDAHTASSIITMNFPVSDENMSIVFFWNLSIWFCTVCNNKEKRTLSIILFISRGERRSRHMMDIGREYIGIKQSHGSHQTEYRRNHSVPDLHVRDITPSLILHHREKKYFSR